MISVVSRKNKFSTFEIVHLTQLAVLLAVAKIVLRLPLHVPGKSGLFTVAFLLIGYSFVRKWGAATYASLVACLLLTSIGQGEGLLLSLPRWLARGLVLDTVCYLGGRKLSLPILAVAGAVGGQSKSLTLFLILALAGSTQGLLAAALAYSASSHLVFGALGGALAFYVIRSLEAGGFFTYLEERR